MLDMAARRCEIAVAMSLRFVPARRTILLCDYGLGGFRAPEMIKRRPAVVVSPRLRHRNDLCAVVPLSTTAPINPVAHVVQITLPHRLPPPFLQMKAWAKCDMIATVSLDRLDLFRTKLSSGRRQYIQPRLSDTQFDAVITAMLHGIGLGHLTLTRPGAHW